MLTICMHTLRHYVNLVETYIRAQEDHINWTEQNINDLKDMYDDNWSDEDMSAYFGISHNALQKALGRYYPDRTLQITRWTDSKKQELIKLKQQEKYTDPQIADRLGISVKSVHRALHRFFPDREKHDNAPQGITIADAEKMTDQYKNGRSPLSICNDYNVGVSSVYQWIRKYCKEMGLDFLDIQQQFKANRSAYLAKQAQKKIVRPGTQDNLRSKGPGSRHRADYRGKQY